MPLRPHCGAPWGTPGQNVGHFLFLRGPTVAKKGIFPSSLGIVCHAVPTEGMEEALSSLPCAFDVLSTEDEIKSWSL